MSSTEWTFCFDGNFSDYISSGHMSSKLEKYFIDHSKHLRGIIKTSRCNYSKYIVNEPFLKIQPVFYDCWSYESQ